jgi:hypothetical protein
MGNVDSFKIYIRIKLRWEPAATYSKGTKSTLTKVDSKCCKPGYRSSSRLSMINHSHTSSPSSDCTPTSKEY